MGSVERQAAIRTLQDVRGSKVLVHFLSDRRTLGNVPIPGISTQLAGEAYPFIYEHLQSFGPSEKLDLFLHTSGGQLDGVWPIVRLLRSFANEFSILVPARALSAGTLICLGADHIVMGEAAHLSPTDPTTGNAFNPKSGPQPIPISVEDVTSYFDLARGDESDEDASADAGLKSEEQMLEVFKALTKEVHPLALGNVKRVHTQIRALSRRLLGLHMNGDDAISRIVSTFTEGLYSHSHLIGRTEAADILGEDIVLNPSEDEAQAMWDLYGHYVDLFDLKSTFSVKDWIGDQEEAELSVLGGVIESEDLSHVFRATSKVRQISQLPQGVQLQIPAGQRMPLVPGVPTATNIEAIRQGWYDNSEGE